MHTRQLFHTCSVTQNPNHEQNPSKGTNIQTSGVLLPFLFQSSYVCCVIVLNGKKKFSGVDCPLLIISVAHLLISNMSPRGRCLQFLQNTSGSNCVVSTKKNTQTLIHNEKRIAWCLFEDSLCTNASICRSRSLFVWSRFWIRMFGFCLFRGTDGWQYGKDRVTGWHKEHESILDSAPLKYFMVSNENKCNIKEGIKSS